MHTTRVSISLLVLLSLSRLALAGGPPVFVNHYVPNYAHQRTFVGWDGETNGTYQAIPGTWRQVNLPAGVAVIEWHLQLAGGEDAAGMGATGFARIRPTIGTYAPVEGIPGQFATPGQIDQPAYGWSHGVWVVKIPAGTYSIGFQAQGYLDTKTLWVGDWNVLGPDDSGGAQFPLLNEPLWPEGRAVPMGGSWLLTVWPDAIYRVGTRQ